MTRWEPLAGTGLYYMYGPCCVIAQIGERDGVYYVHAGYDHRRTSGPFASLLAAKRAGKRRVRELVIEARNRAQNAHIEAEEWLRVNG